MRRKRMHRIYKPKSIVTMSMVEDEQYIVKKCATYFDRLLERHDLIDDETFDFLNWILGANIEKIGTYLLSRLKEPDRERFEEDLSESGFDSDAYKKAANRVIKKSRKRTLSELKVFIQDTLRARIKKLQYRGASGIEKNISALKKMFDLTDQETEFTTFFFIINAYEPATDYFDRHLHCDAFMGRKYLTTLLQINQKDLNEIFSGKLFMIEFFGIDDFISLNDEFRDLLQNPSGKKFSKTFFTGISRKAISLERHLIDKKQTEHILKLLQDKPETSTHNPSVRISRNG